MTCAAQALPGKSHCFAHDPSLAAKRQAAYIAGGHGKSNASRAHRCMIMQGRRASLSRLEDGCAPPQYSTDAIEAPIALIVPSVTPRCIGSTHSRHGTPVPSHGARVAVSRH
jgi:hypothetical protein